MLTRHVGRIASPWLLLAGVAVAAVAFGYARLLDGQGTPLGDSARTSWVFAVLVVVAAIAVIGAFVGPAAWRALAASIATGVLLPLGVIAAFSIGTPLVLAGVLAALAWAGAIREAASRATSARSAVACVTAIVILVAGFVLTA